MKKHLAIGLALANAAVRSRSFELTELRKDLNHIPD